MGEETMPAANTGMMTAMGRVSRRTLLYGLAAAPVVLRSAGRARAQSANTVVVAIGGDPSSLDPLAVERDADEVRAWCAEHCIGDYMVVLGREVVFQFAEDAALATLWWRAEQR